MQRVEPPFTDRLLFDAGAAQHDPKRVGLVRAAAQHQPIAYLIGEREFSVFMEGELKTPQEFEELIIRTVEGNMRHLVLYLNVKMFVGHDFGFKIRLYFPG